MIKTKSIALLAVSLLASFGAAAPSPLNVLSASSPSVNAPSKYATAAASSKYWLANTDKTQDTVWMNNDKSYQVFRNVKDYGAKGDGSTDDTAAINRAIADGARCGGDASCDSTTITPAIVFFPAGTYRVSKPIQMYYYTQVIGDALALPTIKATADFQGMAMLDADPYMDGGVNWFTNQNNFFRQVRNLVIDVSPAGNGMTGAGIHWQVAQATSLQNIVFKMSTNPATKQIGIFMDNGSGGFFSDLIFEGGQYGAFLGSQQFTTRNLTFNNCQTAIFMNWNWGWTLQGINVNGGSVALDMSNSPQNQTVGSVMLLDSTFNNVDVGVRYAYKNDQTNTPTGGGTLVLDNVNMLGARKAAIMDTQNKVVLAPSKIETWVSGRAYNTAADSRRIAQQISAPAKPASLLNARGAVYTRGKPQYENLPVSSFVSAKSVGCKGDGITDDTACIQKLLNSVANTQKVAYFPHGAYIVTDTVRVPPNVKITGSIWPLIVAKGAKFADQKNPRPVFQVGSKGQSGGAVEISDLIFESAGPAPGAIMIEWNLESPATSPSGVWDTHVRIGGSAGTLLDSGHGCAKNPQSTAVPANCMGVFLMFHATPSSGGVYLENTWFWVADHDLDEGKPGQISLYSGRGVLIESQQGPVWLWGTASEHSALYNYFFNGVKALFSGFMQTETPYYQPNPAAPKPFAVNAAYHDPNFAACSSNGSAGAVPCKDAWGVLIKSSSGVHLYGTGLYSFFNNYDQECVGAQNCQENMVHIINSQVAMYGVSTKAAVNMIVEDGVPGSVKDADNRSNFCATLGYYFSKGVQAVASY